MKTVPSCTGVIRLLSAVAFTVIATAAPIASAPAPQSSSAAQSFAIIAGTAVTCTASRVTGNVGVWPGTAVTQTEGCIIDGTVHAADAAAERAYLDFVNRYNALRDQPPPCTTLTGTLAGEVLTPGVYCVDAVAKTGTLILDAQGNPNASFTFLVNGALEATNFNVVLINGGDACNVEWWVRDAATLTTSTFIGTILAGAAITVTGGSFHGNAYAKAAVTVTGVASFVGCDGRAGPGPGPGAKAKCNQGVGNGPEGCDPGNSNHRNPSNDERGGTPGKPGRKGPGR